MKKAKVSRLAPLSYMSMKHTVQMPLCDTVQLVLRGSCFLKELHNTTKNPIFHYKELEWNSEVWGTCAGEDGQAVWKTVRALGGRITTSLKSVGNLSPHYYNKLQKPTQPWQEVLELQPKGREANIYLENRLATGSTSLIFSCNNQPEHLPCLKGQELGQTFLPQSRKTGWEMNCYVVVLAMQYHTLKMLLKTSQSGEMPCSSGLHSLADICNKKPKHDTSSDLSLPSEDKDTFSLFPAPSLPPDMIYFAV